MDTEREIDAVTSQGTPRSAGKPREAGGRQERNPTPRQEHSESTCQARLLASRTVKELRFFPPLSHPSGDGIVPAALGNSLKEAGHQKSQSA